MVNKKELKVTYDNWGDDYDSYIKEEHKFYEEAKYYDKLFKENKANTILDCGCGTGRHTTYFREWGYDVDGSDLSDGMLEQGRKRAKEKGLDINFFQGAFQELDKKCNRKYDGMLVAGLGIAHLTNDQELNKGITNIYKVMNEGGIVIFENRRLEDFINEKQKIHFGPMQVYNKNSNQILNFRVLNYNGDNTANYNVIVMEENDKGEWDYETRSFPLWLGITDKLTEMLPKVGFSKVRVIDSIEFLREHGKTNLTIAVK